MLFRFMHVGLANLLIIQQMVTYANPGETVVIYELSVETCWDVNSCHEKNNRRDANIPNLSKRSTENSQTRRIIFVALCPH